jgi:nucleoside 2-deoxyribosyltransferase
MNLYLAGQYASKDYLRTVADQLICDGHFITASWLQEHHPPTVQLHEVSNEELRGYAVQDIEDIRASDAMVFFSVIDATKRGGRHVEMGVALALGLPVYVVGPRENIFMYLPQVKLFTTVEELRRVL